ncbi:hypothetical protein PINS_up001463 [Pythium insidiosum]|nr:hypothetical protein PINS_up001463 [Pythium insidiosum]
MESLADDDRVRALRELLECLSSPTRKFEAVDRELLFTCAELTESPSVEVRTQAALVIASLVLYENVRTRCCGC